MKVSISKSPTMWLTIVVAVIVLMAVIRATPETWGIKKYFQPV